MRDMPMMTMTMHDKDGDDNRIHDNDVDGDVDDECDNGDKDGDDNVIHDHDNDDDADDR